MSIEAILSANDEQIAKLQRARAMLADDITSPLQKSPERPQKKTVTPEAPFTKSRRMMSAEGRARIAAAQKKRWAAAKKATR